MSKKTNTLSELIEMQTGFALLDSMLRSKLLSVMVILGLLGFVSFFYHLLKIAGT